jgi:hypothetical protein
MKPMPLGLWLAFNNLANPQTVTSERSKVHDTAQSLKR